MGKGLTLPKWGLIVRPKIPPNAQFVCPSPKVLDFNEKRSKIILNFVFIEKKKISLGDFSQQSNKKIARTDF